MKSVPHTARRFNFPEPDGQVAAGPKKLAKPADTPCHDELCPYCRRPLPEGSTSVGLVRLGIKQLFGAVYLIAAGILRCLRFALAGVLCLIGLIGSCCFGLAARVAHRDDRKLLFRR